MQIAKVSRERGKVTPLVEDCQVEDIWGMTSKDGITLRLNTDPDVVSHAYSVSFTPDDIVFLKRYLEQYETNYAKEQG